MKKFKSSKFVRVFAFTVIILSVIALSLFLMFIYPCQPFAKILMYHSISNEEVSVGYPTIDKNLFMRQMDYLSRHGYEPVFLRAVIQKYKEGKSIPPKQLVLTFDLGYSDFYYIVYPQLKKYKFKATVFVLTSCMDADGCLTWEQLQEMKNSGLVEIGSHSVDHPPLTCVSSSEAKKEIVMSKAILEEKLEIPILTFCYPYGAVNSQVEELVEEAGYEGAVGIVYRMGEFKLNDVYNLNRVYVSKTSKFPLAFRFMVSGYYVPTRALALRLLNIKTPRGVGDYRER